MCFFKKKSKNGSSEAKVVNNTSHPTQSDGYVSGLYYSNWSPYKPRHHFPHDIDTEQITHLYYAFFLVDPKTGYLKSSDTWSDFEMTIRKHTNELPGCIGEFTQLRRDDFKQSGTMFKLIMSVGGWSNKDAFPKMVRDGTKLTNFIDSCIDTMFKYGFDGVDLDWEFPEDDGLEPMKYYEIVKRLRVGLNRLETKIWGKASNRFHLSVAAPAFEEKLRVLPIHKMDQYVDLWNMMTYDYYGDWSEVTGLHCNLYNGSNGTDGEEKKRIKVQYKHDSNSKNSQDLNGDSAIRYMLNHFRIDPGKIVLGMAMYGRGFKNVDVSTSSVSNNILASYLGKQFDGVGGESEGEPGIWLYNQLPIKHSKELFDPTHVAAYCVDADTKTLVGYDNVESISIKSQYVTSRGLAGAFWWESCGNKWDDKEQSLVNVYTTNVDALKRTKQNIYSDSAWRKFYISKYGKEGFLFPICKETIKK